MSAVRQNSVIVDEISIVSPSGETVDVRALMTSLIIKQTILTPYISGIITILDSNNIIERLPIIGEEYINISFKEDADAEAFKQMYMIYKVKKVTSGEKQNLQAYALEFCTPEFVVSEGTYISRTYTGTPDTIIETILKQDIGTKKSFITNKSIYVRDFVAPRVKPFDAISILSRAATNGKPDLFMFYETYRSYRFSSLYELYQQTAFASYNFGVKNVQKSDKFREQINSYTFIKQKDNLLAVGENGMYARNLLSFDPLGKTFKEKTLDASNFPNIENSKFSLSSPNNPYSQLSGPYRTIPTRSYAEPFINDVKSEHYEDYLIERDSILARINQIVVRFDVAGDREAEPGAIIDIEVPKFTSDNDEKGNRSEYLSGRYLIIAVVHTIVGQEFTTTIEASRDTYGREIKSSL